MINVSVKHIGTLINECYDSTRLRFVSRLFFSSRIRGPWLLANSRQKKKTKWIIIIVLLQKRINKLIFVMDDGLAYTITIHFTLAIINFIKFLLIINVYFVRFYSPRLCHISIKLHFVSVQSNTALNNGIFPMFGDVEQKHFSINYETRKLCKSTDTCTIHWLKVYKMLTCSNTIFRNTRFPMMPLC